VNLRTSPLFIRLIRLTRNFERRSNLRKMFRVLTTEKTTATALMMRVRSPFLNNLAMGEVVAVLGRKITAGIYSQERVRLLQLTCKTT